MFKNNNIELIWAQSSNGIIGNNGSMPWHIPEDMRYFTANTQNKSVIMGSRTWDGLYKKPLPNRENIVLTSKAFLDDVKPPTKIAHSLPEALTASTKTPIIIGGKQVYDVALNYATRLYVTVINKEFSGDTYAPKIPAEFKEISKQTITSKVDNIELEFKVYEK